MKDYPSEVFDILYALSECHPIPTDAVPFLALCEHDRLIHYVKERDGLLLDITPYGESILEAHFRYDDILPLPSLTAELKRDAERRQQVLRQTINESDLERGARFVFRRFGFNGSFSIGDGPGQWGTGGNLVKGTLAALPVLIRDLNSQLTRESGSTVQQTANLEAGYLGLIVDADNRKIRRRGYDAVVDLAGRRSLWHTFQVFYAAGDRDASNEAWSNGYPGEWDAHRQTLADLRVALSSIDITIPHRKRRLADSAT